MLLASAVVLLKSGDENAERYVKDKSISINFFERGSVAEALGEIPSKYGESILISMLNDENTNVKVQVISSIGKLKTESSLTHLMPLLKSSNIRIREAVVEASGEIKSPESIKPLEQRALDKTEMMKIRLKAITSLGEIGTDEAVSSLLSIFKSVEEPYQHGILTALGKLRSKEALQPFLDLLKKYEKQKRTWRKFRDTWLESFTEKEEKAWMEKFQNLKPKQYLEFELGHAISRIDAKSGIELLEHDIAGVRKGAWTGLGETGAAPLVMEIYEKRKQERETRKKPWFIDAAYRAIDKSLIRIEHFGTKEDLEKLEKFLPTVENRDTDAVYTRVEWTVDRLREKYQNRNGGTGFPSES